MVRSFESIAVRCGEQLFTSSGARRFGGHTPRVMGTRALTAHGVEIGKIRILARHSGESIYRYAGDAPLAALQGDIDSHQRVILLGNSAHLRPARHDAAVVEGLRKLREQLDGMEARLTLQEQRAFTPTPVTHLADAGLVQNAATLAVHRFRTNSTSLTMCGWSINSSRLASGAVRLLDSLVDVPWTSLCSRCLHDEREAAMCTPGALSDSGSE